MQQQKWHHDADFFLGVKEYDHINIGFGIPEVHIEWHFSIDWDGTEPGIDKLVKKAGEIVEALNAFDWQGAYAEVYPEPVKEEPLYGDD